LPVQTGGAGGTLAAGTVLTAGSSTDPFGLADDLAAQLGLAAAPAPWHTNRLAVTSLGDALAGVVDALGKIAADVLFLSRPEVAEVAEPRAPGRGASSAMPQKQNPVLSVLVRSAALQAPGLAAQLHLAAATFNDERPDGAWHTEWPALRQLLALALGAAGHVRELAEGLQVFPDAMRRNLDLSGPLLLSEGVSAAVAPLLSVDEAGADGKQQLQAVVDRTLQAPAGEQTATYRRLLRETVPADKLSGEELDSLLDPANYLGQAGAISRRILAAFPDYARPSTQPERNGDSRG
jgi:3-carboxy-cis,cis-muconate cycloisomerase